MPIEVMKNIIGVTCDKNDIVIDPFAGIGSTLIACEKSNRKWIGIEISEHYCSISKKRIEQNSNQMKMF